MSKIIGLCIVVLVIALIGATGYVSYDIGYKEGYSEGKDEGMYVTCEIIRECRDGLSEGELEPFFRAACPSFEDEYGEYCTIYLNRHREVVDDSIEF